MGFRERSSQGEHGQGEDQEALASFLVSLVQQEGRKARWNCQRSTCRLHRGPPGRDQVLQGEHASKRAVPHRIVSFSPALLPAPCPSPAHPLFSLYMPPRSLTERSKLLSTRPRLLSLEALQHQEA